VVGWKDDNVVDKGGCVVSCVGVIVDTGVSEEVGENNNVGNLVGTSDGVFVA